MNVSPAPFPDSVRTAEMPTLYPAAHAIAPGFAEDMRSARPTSVFPPEPHRVITYNTVPLSLFGPDTCRRFDSTTENRNSTTPPGSLCFDSGKQKRHAASSASLESDHCNEGGLGGQFPSPAISEGDVYAAGYLGQLPSPATSDLCPLPAAASMMTPSSSAYDSKETRDKCEAVDREFAMLQCEEWKIFVKDEKTVEDTHALRVIYAKMREVLASHWGSNTPDLIRRKTSR